MSSLLNIPSEVWGAAAGSGFNAILVLILLIYGRMELRNGQSELKNLSEALDRNSRSINNFIMAISVEHHVFRKQAEELSKEIDAAEARRSATSVGRR